jgi:transcriptional regulator
MLILQALNEGEMHGYGVARWIEERTEGTLVIEEGSLYPALYRMEKRGWVESRWGASENNRRARYYEMTEAGKKQLDKETRSWARLVWAINRIVPVPSA